MADHHVGHFLRIRVLGAHIADELAVAQDGDTVGQLLDLVHLVGDDDDSLTVIAHVAQHGEELVRLLRSEDGGRLIEDQDIRAAVEHLDYLDRLLLGNGHVVYLLVGVDFEAVSVADLLYLGGGVLQIELSGQAEDDVLRGGQHVDKLEVLVDHADAEVESILRGAYDDGLAVDAYLALVREVDAGEHVHKRRLAAAVLAEERKYLAPVYIEPDSVICDDGAEGLRDIAHFDCRDLIVQYGHSLMYVVKSNTA